METYVGDTVNLDVDTAIDLTGYTGLYIKFRRPNGSVGFWTAAIDPLDSTHMIYQTDLDDLNMAGAWTIQAHAEALGVHLHGKWYTFTVLTPLAETSTPPTTAAPTTPTP